MTSEECRPDQLISFENVSRFYGEILGVNRVNLTITPGITSLVGPNGSGKTTLMNLMTGLIQPTRGRVSVLGISPSDPQRLFRLVGYCGQFDSFPKGMTGYQFINSFLRVHGYERKVAEEMSWQAIERVGLVDAADRKVAGYSKGMRQRIRLAQSIAHQPVVMVLDEPLNGLDPMARAETIRLFRDLAREGLHLIISSHILHEVDTMSDRVVLINNGYILAEGGVTGVREEIEDHPMQIMVGCDRPRELAARLFAASHIVEVQLYSDLQGADLREADRKGLLIKTTNADAFFLLINQIVTESDLAIDLVMPVDDDLSAVYHYLIGSSGGGEA
ncbi:MAG: ABC transporter ATP-binding protein [Blastocatellia bacterium]|jgi:ABC-2 type transport system ATP-binding protein